MSRGSTRPQKRVGRGGPRSSSGAPGLRHHSTRQPNARWAHRRAGAPAPPGSSGVVPTRRSRPSTRMAGVMPATPGQGTDVVRGDPAGPTGRMSADGECSERLEAPSIPEPRSDGELLRAGGRSVTAGSTPGTRPGPGRGWPGGAVTGTWSRSRHGWPRAARVSSSGRRIRASCLPVRPRAGCPRSPPRAAVRT
jgi:hypothetical protein